MASCTVTKTLFYCLVLLQIIHCAHGYDDELANSSISLVPALLGSVVKLRCLKVLQDVSMSDYTTKAACTNVGGGCAHMWSKRGTILGRAGNVSSSKYEFSAVTTHGYCATFDDTKQRFDSLTVNFNQTAKSSKSGLICLVSTMTIYNVTMDDLGVYMCNFSIHGNEVENWPAVNWRRGRDPELDLVEVALSSSGSSLKNELIYMALAYQGTKEDFVIQCVSTGEKIKWIVQPSDYSYYCSYDSHKINPKICLGYGQYETTLDEFSTMDYWRSYNYTLLDSTPDDDVYESFLAVQGATLLDRDQIACVVNATSTGKLMTITRKGYRNYWDASDGVPIATGVTSVILGLLIIVFVIIAVFRSGCCDGNSSQVVSLAVPV